MSYCRHADRRATSRPSATDLARVAAVGDESTGRAADLLAIALEPALARRFQEALAEAALELSGQLERGRVEVRIAGGDPELVYVATARSAPAESGDAAFERPHHAPSPREPEVPRSRRPRRPAASLSTPGSCRRSAACSTPRRFRRRRPPSSDRLRPELKGTPCHDDASHRVTLHHARPVRLEVRIPVGDIEVATVDGAESTVTSRARRSSSTPRARAHRRPAHRRVAPQVVRLGPLRSLTVVQVRVPSAARSSVEIVAASVDATLDGTFADARRRSPPPGTFACHRRGRRRRRPSRP